ncbi:MAG: STAS domain-containing protein [Treponema sp.]|jgi:anti-sigma B factor antagonist|nr:STAS domain-containing protein [Treponema sp.]
MEIKILKNDDEIYIIEPQNELNLYSSNQLKELVMKMIELKIERFIISLKKVENVNSSGIGALIYISSTIKKLNFSLAITGINKPVEKAINAIRLSGYFPITGSLREAVDLVRQDRA